MRLQDELPRRVCVKGRTYRADFDFKRVLTMMEIMERDDLMPEARDFLALKCVMRRPPRDVKAGMDAVKALLFPDTKRPTDRQKITDFEQDAELIRAAFLQEYGINLYREKLHWIEFTGLLSGLPEGSRYSDVLGIRARPMPEPTQWNQKERQWLAKAKAELAVRLTDKEAEKSLRNGLRGVALSLMALAEKGGNGDA